MHPTSGRYSSWSGLSALCDGIGKGRVEHMKLNWWPTFKCNLRCAYCAARALPFARYGEERSGAEWLEVFAQWPQLDKLMSSGREATCYGDLSLVMDAVDWPLMLETNLEIHPKEWMTDSIAERLVKMRTTLHRHVEHRLATAYWEKIQWLRETVPKTVVYATTLVTQQTDPKDVETFKRRSTDAGAHLVKINYVNEAFLWRDYISYQGSVGQCVAGSDGVVLLPDGTAFRCTGHAYYGINPLGNVFEVGADVLLAAPAPCTFANCSCRTEKITDHDAALVEGAHRTTHHSWALPRQRVEDYLGQRL